MVKEICCLNFIGYSFWVKIAPREAAKCDKPLYSLEVNIGADPGVSEA